MQVLKDEIRQAIIAHAERLFLEKGYESASMRDLAQLIPMSVSNLYKYFPDKFSLFAHFVYPQYDLFLSRMNAFLDEENEGNYTPENIEYVSQSLYKGINAHRTAFLLLMDNQNVPKYGDFRAKLCELFAEHLYLGTDSGSGFDRLLVSIITQNIWDGIFCIFKHRDNEEVREQEIALLMKYHFKGLSLFHDTQS